MARYGEASWFNLGDRDLSTHIHRTDCLRRGLGLAEVTGHIARALGVRSRVLPMTESYTPTRVITDEGEMHFQEYFVRRKCEPPVRGIRFDGIESALPAPGVESSIRDADAIIVCPSNPLISIGPILAVPGVREALRETRAVKLAVSPDRRRQGAQGSAAEMLRGLSREVSARGVAEMYGDFLDISVLDIMQTPAYDRA